MIEQMAAGIATAVRSGYYRAGDRLPTLHEMSAQLGVSLAVPRRAVARLVRDGLLQSARRRGITVCAAAAPAFRAQVLYATPGSPGSFYFATRDAVFYEALADAGIRLTTVHWGGDRAEHARGLLYQAIDSGSVDLAVLNNSEWCRELCVSKGIRCISLFSDASEAHAREDVLRLDAQMPAFRLLRHVRSCGARSVGLLPGAASAGLQAAARKVGLAIVPLRARASQTPEPTSFSAEAVGYAVGRALARRPAAGRPDAVCLRDDYQVRGLFMAFAQAGLRVPEDIQVAAVLNVGHFPVIGRAITRIEMDPARDGRAMADAVLRRLRSEKRTLKTVTLVPHFHAGDTTRRR